MSVDSNFFRLLIKRPSTVFYRFASKWQREILRQWEFGTKAVSWAISRAVFQNTVGDKKEIRDAGFTFKVFRKPMIQSLCVDARQLLDKNGTSLRSENICDAFERPDMLNVLSRPAYLARHLSNTEQRKRGISDGHSALVD